MSRTPSTQSLTVVSGSTWEDEFIYTDENGAGIDLTGYGARMQVRTRAGRFGTTTATTLVLELTTANTRLVIDTPAGQTVPCRVLIYVTGIDTKLLNTANVKRVKLAYSIEVYNPAISPEYVIPLAKGSVSVSGETTR